jgi:hypothetical protein
LLWWLVPLFGLHFTEDHNPPVILDHLTECWSRIASSLSERKLKELFW